MLILLPLSSFEHWIFVIFWHKVKTCACGHAGRIFNETKFNLRPNGIDGNNYNLLYSFHWTIRKSKTVKQDISCIWLLKKIAYIKQEKKKQMACFNLIKINILRKIFMTEGNNTKTLVYSLLPLDKFIKHFGLIYMT